MKAAEDLLLSFAFVVVSACGSSVSPSTATDSGVEDGGSVDASFSDAPVTSPEPVSSLNLEQVWYITQSTNSDLLIDFRTTPPSVTCNGLVGSSDGFEGTGVFTDPDSGDLIFYTDGRKVFNGADNELLVDGEGLSGDSSATEPALIAPKNDGTDRRFYIFTNATNVSAPSVISYSEIDLDMGASGTVTAKNVPLLDGNPGEALDLLPHANGSDFWVLAYDGASTMKAFLVTESGINTTPVESDIGLTGEVRRGSINHTYDYAQLVLGQNYGGADGLIATASFDAETGKVGTANVIATGDMGYHGTFSEDGTKVYYVRGSEGWRGIAYQYDLLTNTETELGGENMAAAKLAPDGKVYWAAQGKPHLGVVENPNAAGLLAGFSEVGLNLEGCTSGYGVPNQTAAFTDFLTPID